METIAAYVNSLIAVPLDLNLRISIFYLYCTVIIAFLIWKYRGSPDRFLSWLIPKEVYTHKSNILDIKLFLANRLFSVLGILGAVAFPSAVAYFLMATLSGSNFSPPPISWVRSLVATIIIVIATDFCKYWAHRAHHEWRFLWPFHAVHHSANVLTPLTVHRAHPVEPIVRGFLMTIIVGLIQGLILYFIVGQISIVAIGGANVMYFFFNALGSNFRHSHIWISYGRVIEHILISPAQHQVHHSVAIKHHDKNYGSIFAVWDWMFGTLYVPPVYEKLTFGVSDGTGKPIDQPYPTLVAALVVPFKESWKAISKLLNTDLSLTRTITPNAVPMTKSFSLWLDVLRAGAALTVLFGHMAHIRFTRGDYFFLRDWNVASDAVIVFFVLSGVVIFYAAGRDQTLGRFAFNRLTRIASVLFPALLITLAFDAIGTSVDKSAYPNGFYQELTLGEFLWRGMTVTNLWYGISDWVRLGTNGPIWSLSYEVGFYLIFGSLMFLKGPIRLVVLTLLMLLLGIPILALFPAWWIGVMVWKNASDNKERNSPVWSWIMVVGGVVALVGLKVSGAPQLLENATILALQPYNHHSVLLYSNEFLWNTIIAVGVAIHLIGVRRLTLDMSERTEGAIAKSVRWIAGGSFSLYVVHYPTLHLLDATLPETLPGYDFWLLGLTLTTCFVFAALFERPLKRIRDRITSLWGYVSKTLSNQSNPKI